MKSKHPKIQFLISIAVVILLAHSGSAQGAVNGTFLYNLSNFTGVVSCSWPRVFIDQERTEIYVTYQNLVKIFNEDGMEVYSFGDELDLGSLVDLTLDKGGDIIILSYKYDEKTNKTSYEITKCNYRGEPKSKIQVKNLPSKYSEFVPNRIIYWGGNFYFVSLQTMIVIIVDPDGNFKEDYDILPLLELEEKAKQDAQMEALSIDKDGNFLFTIPPLFRAYKITPDRKVSYFGSPGSIPGKFNIVAGITSDDKGNIFVVDKLKSSVMIYDKNFKFLNQFSSRGWKSNFLLAPEDIEIDNHDRVYITQAGKKGVSVFRITY
jgi:hypothetical protein